MIYVSLFAVLALVVLRHPPAAAAALLCTWAIDQWARSQDNFFFVNRGITNYVTSFMVLGALGLRILKGRTLFKPTTREYAVMAAIYGMAALSIIWSIQPEASIEQLKQMARIILIFGFLTTLLVSDLEDLKVLLYTLLAIGVFVCVMVLVTGQWQGRSLMFATEGVFTERDLERGNPLAIASTAGYVAMIATLLNFRGAARVWQVVRYVVIALAFAVCLKSGSRGQTVAVLFVVLCFLPYSRRFKDLRSFAALVISVSLFAMIAFYLLSVLTFAEGGGGDRWSWQAFKEEYQASRIGTSSILLAAWADAGPFYWLIGLGSSASFDTRIIGFYPHVVFAEVLGELGLIGWVLLWLAPIFSYQNLREMWGYVKEESEERGLIAALGAMILFEIIMSFKQGSLLSSGIAFAFIVMLGRITKTSREEVARYQLLDAGMYPMSEADWSDVGDYDEAMAGGAMARGQ